MARRGAEGKGSAEACVGLSGAGRVRSVPEQRGRAVSTLTYGNPYIAPLSPGKFGVTMVSIPGVHLGAQLPAPSRQRRVGEGAHESDIRYRRIRTGRI